MGKARRARWNVNSKELFERLVVDRSVAAIHRDIENCIDVIQPFEVIGADGSTVQQRLPVLSSIDVFVRVLLHHPCGRG